MQSAGEGKYESALQLLGDVPTSAERVSCGRSARLERINSLVNVVTEVCSAPKQSVLHVPLAEGTQELTLDRTPRPLQHHRTRVIRLLPFRLRVDSHEVKSVPHGL